MLEFKFVHQLSIWRFRQSPGMNRTGLQEASPLSSASPASRAPRVVANGEILSSSDRAKVRDRAIVMILANRGHCVQEVLKPAQKLEAAGCTIVFASLDGGEVRFDPLCNILAQMERAWDPTARLLRSARGRGRLADLPSLRQLASRGQLEGWQSRFDAIVVPGGHGETFAAFMRDRLVTGLVDQFLSSGRVTALMCHAVVIAAWLTDHGAAAVAGRTVTCWPRAYEEVERRIPVLGRYLAPLGATVASQLEKKGSRVLDSIMPGRHVNAVIDGNLVTGRGPWSADAFAAGVVNALSALPARVAAAGELQTLRSPS